MATKKPAPKPAPKAPALRKPDMTPINAVRNPNFDSAMAMRNYKNSMEAQQASLAAKQGRQNAEDIYNRLNKFNVGLDGPIDPQARLAGRGGDFTQGRLMGAPSGQGGFGGMTADQAGIPADQRKILDDLMARDQVNFAANEAKRQDFMKTQKPVGGSIAGPIYGSLAGNVLANGSPANMSPDQLNAMRMQQYNQFLGQGMQNSNTLNQSAMPAGGMGMQQPRQAPAPRKFSIASNPSAKAF